MVWLSGACTAGQPHHEHRRLERQEHCKCRVVLDFHCSNWLAVSARGCTFFLRKAWSKRFSRVSHVSQVSRLLRTAAHSCSLRAHRRPLCAGPIFKVVDHFPASKQCLRTPRSKKIRLKRKLGCGTPSCERARENRHNCHAMVLCRPGTHCNRAQVPNFMHIHRLRFQMDMHTNVVP